MTFKKRYFLSMKSLILLKEEFVMIYLKTYKRVVKLQSL